jgi:hypothetical protein
MLVDVGITWQVQEAELRPLALQVVQTLDLHQRNVLTVHYQTPMANAQVFSQAVVHQDQT